MAQAYVPIQTVTVGSGGSASIEFTNIPQTYTDLSLLCTLRLTSGGIEAVDFTFNNDTGANYSWVYLQGTGSGLNYGSGSAASAFTEAMVTNGSTSTASTFSNSWLYIPNYAGSNSKSFSLDTVEEENATAAYMRLEAGLWSNSAAITSIKIYGSANFAQYSTATLYGIGGARASGGTITADAKYTYHTFTSTGTFTALEKIKGAEVLCVAGGGGGGCTYGGGGGAGGVLYTPGQLLPAGTSYTAVVGSGGGGSSSRNSKGTTGSNSSFSSLAAVGGGGGGSYNTKNGSDGGSGGGGGGESGTNGSATTNQGNAGGNASGGHGAGGGGAGGVGGNAGTYAIGNGGPATENYSSWAVATGTGVVLSGIYFYAGGGSGGSNNDGTPLGLVTGGAGQGKYANGNSATANTGSGGGGGGLTSGVDGNGGNGGSGLVIIRYPN